MQDGVWSPHFPEYNKANSFNAKIFLESQSSDSDVLPNNEVAYSASPTFCPDDFYAKR